MISFHTRIIMDSGKEYVIKKHPEDLLPKFKNDLGIVYNGFVKLEDVTINPSHISSIENIKIDEKEEKEIPHALQEDEDYSYNDW